MSFDINFICQAARERWLSPAEIGFLLNNWGILGLAESLHPPINPGNGDLYLYDRKRVRDFKNDGVDWIKKKGDSRIREDFVRFSIQDGEALTGFYTYSAVNESFRRRSYRYSREGSTRFVVHYRVCSEDVRRRPGLSSSEFSNTMELLLDPSQFAPSRSGSMEFTEHSFDTGGFEDCFSNHSSVPGLEPDALDAFAEDWAAESSSDAGGVDESLASILSSESAPLAPSSSYSSSLPRIIDLAPSEGSSNGGTKVLLCLSVQWPVIIPFECLVNFGSTAVLGQRITDNVVRCFTPVLPAGVVTVHLTTTDGRILTAKSSESLFSFIDSMSTSVVPSYGQPFSPGVSLLSALPNRTPNEHNQYPIFAALSPNQTLGKRTHDDIRQHKIRIVEKLESVKSVLIPENSSNSPTAAAGPIEGDFASIEWLDDSTLDTLATTDLEKLTDRYVGAVMKGLLNVASADEDLQSSFNDVDTLGFNLLHYCAMYKLNDLIRPLLEKGARINQITSFGSTALHLACSCGNAQAVQLLLFYGANASIPDAAGLTAEQVAIAAGFEDIAKLVLQQPIYLSGSTSRSSLDDGQMTPESYVPLRSNELNSARYLQEAFESLSVADKCALSISLGHHQQYLQTMYQTPSVDGMKAYSAVDADRSDLDSSHDAVEISDDFEMQSVLSEISEGDKKSVDAFLKMMNPLDKKKLENEVKLIQNNVRGWLLRKNYINLREATKLLQVTWREKRKQGERKTAPPVCIGGSLILPALKPAATTAITALQAATRGMLARKAFEKLHLQAMSSLVFQKSFSHRVQVKTANSSTPPS